MPKEISLKSVSLQKATLYYTGPSFEEGPLPTLFYFALSGKDSLTLDPFNQVVQFLSEKPLRIFSLDLPFHGKDQPTKDALKHWAEEIERGNDVIDAFLKKVEEALTFLYEKNLIKNLAAAGLSRGGFIASHLAAREKRVEGILGFAPLTDLSLIKDFQNMQDHPLVKSSSLKHLAGKIFDRKICFLIGNRDERVSTKSCFATISAFAEKAFSERIRTSPIELIIAPSIGHLGHGTSPDTFEKGAKWLEKILL